MPSQRKSIRKAASAKPDGPAYGKLIWYERLKRDHPELYAEIFKAIKDWQVGDQVYRRPVPTQRAFAEFVSEEVSCHAFPVKPNTVTALFRLLAEAVDG